MLVAGVSRRQGNSTAPTLRLLAVFCVFAVSLLRVWSAPSVTRSLVFPTSVSAGEEAALPPSSCSFDFR